MAIWQVPITLLSKQKLLKVHKELPLNQELLSTEKFTEWGRDYSLPKVREILGKGLTEGSSWSVGDLYWGDTSTSDAKLYFEGEDLVEISIRIDLRELRLELVEMIENLCEELDALAYINEKVIEPSISNFKNEFKLSDAYRFLKDPKEYFRSLKDNPID